MTRGAVAAKRRVRYLRCFFAFAAFAAACFARLVFAARALLAVGDCVAFGWSFELPSLLEAAPSLAAAAAA